MEYRRRRKARYAPRQSGAFPAYLLIAAVVAVSVYVFGASKAGAWVAENWIAPVLDRSTAKGPDAAVPSAAPTPAPTAQPVESTVTEELTFPETTFYAVQIGVYSSAENADRQAEELRKIGAAGIVLEDGGRFRVLAAAYPTEESLQKVAEQLRAEGVECASYPIVCGMRTLSITGEEAQIQAFTDAAEAAKLYLDTLYEAVIAFDRDKLSVEDGKKKLYLMIEGLHAAETPLDQMGATGETEKLAGLLRTLTEAAERAYASETTERTVFSSQTKQLYLEAIRSYAAYTES